jgi:hypothetical protein
MVIYLGNLTPRNTRFKNTVNLNAVLFYNISIWC